MTALQLQVLIIHGDRDRLVPLSNSRRLVKQMPYVRLEVVDQCGHSPQEEHPQRFAALVQQFLHS